MFKSLNVLLVVVFPDDRLILESGKGHEGHTG